MCEAEALPVGVRETDPDAVGDAEALTDVEPVLLLEGAGEAEPVALTEPQLDGENDWSAFVREARSDADADADPDTVTEPDGQGDADRESVPLRE